MANYGHVLIFSLIGGLFSLIAAALLISKQKTAAILATYATPFAAGALLAAAFFDLLPEAIEKLAEGAAARWMLGGLLVFFMLEHFLHWFPHHHEHEGEQVKTVAPLIIIGDFIHNFFDGIAIGAAFLINVPTGIVTAVAVAAHEIPQEMGDSGLLLRAGYKRKKVLLINALSALMATVGALLTFWFGSRANLPIGEMLAITAGMFLYIAASDLIPAIHSATKNKLAHFSVVLLLLGVLVVGVTTEAAHKYVELTHNQEVRTFNSAANHNEERDHAENAGGFELPDHETLPEINLQLLKDRTGGYTLLAEVSHFTFTPAAAGGQAMANEGHGHIYIDGQKFGRLYGNAFYLDSVKPGDVVRVTLNANDHTEFTHDGKVIAAEVTVPEDVRDH